jgi:hypothetical protein
MITDLKYQELKRERDKALRGDRKLLAKAERDLKMYVASKLVQAQSQPKQNWHYETVILAKDGGVAFPVFKENEAWGDAKFWAKDEEDAKYLVTLLNLTSGKTADKMAMIASGKYLKTSFKGEAA